MENISFSLPEYEVMIHIKVSAFSKYLEKEIESLTSDFQLAESTGDAHHRDYHWQFSIWKEAVAAGERLKCLVTNPNIELLKVKATNHPEIEPIIYKDVRFSAETWPL
jgi:hypothetical protein